jgi:hypothetical protein
VFDGNTACEHSTPGISIVRGMVAVAGRNAAMISVPGDPPSSPSQNANSSFRLATMVRPRNVRKLAV